METAQRKILIKLLLVGNLHAVERDVGSQMGKF
jgi:hypothetical protein